MLTTREREILLELQRHRVGHAADAKELALGNILVASGKITHDQLDSALRGQLASGLQIGEELVNAGHASRGQVQDGLWLQKKFIAYALVLATVAPLLPIIPSAEAAQNIAAMPVSVMVIPGAKLQTIYQKKEIVISEADIARGQVAVPAALRFSVVTNKGGGYLMLFKPIGELFDSVHVDGLGYTVQLGADGGAIIQRVHQAAEQTHELSFRFNLGTDIKPGIYPWPLLLTVCPL